MSNHTKARADLIEWASTQPKCYFTENPQIKRLAKTHFPPTEHAEKESELAHFGKVCANELDRAAIVNNRHWNLPREARWSDLGERQEAIEHHPSYEICGKAIYEDGRVIAAFAESATPNFNAQIRFYLSSHVGEAGHNCPVACTAGIFKVLAEAASEELKARYLPRVATAEYAERYDGAQFLTEVQGGSDVGANSVVATPDGEEFGTTRWRINGEKWFCSNADADLILMTARRDEGIPGTRGLGLFLVPRILPSGEVNGFHLRRLKDKLGTRSMPSGEVDFKDALGYAVGPADKGFATVMKHVINTSRLYNTVGCAGLSQRATYIAAGYARHRRAFGQPIQNFPMVQEMTALNVAKSRALCAGALTLAALVDSAEQNAQQAGFIRVATNLAKMRSCQHSHDVILTAIETLGGNGAIESFSILPRLLRDNVVYENWEGTHNTLVAQCVRDFFKLRLHEAFFAEVRAKIPQIPEELAACATRLSEEITFLEERVAAASKDSDPGVIGLRLKPLCERMADLFFALMYALDIGTETDSLLRGQEGAALELYIATTLDTNPRLAADYPALVAKVAPLAKF